MYEELAEDTREMLRIGSVDCDSAPGVCSKEKIETFPTFRVYPEFPVPTMDYDYTTASGFSWTALKKMATRNIPNNTVEITSANIDTFINEHPGKPKVLLFTNKKGVPVVFKALSHHFKKTLLFGVVREEESAVVKKYKVKSFPHITLLKNEEKPRKYEGQMSYAGIHEFLNIYSETFVFQGTEDVVESSASKVWLTQTVPELNKDSANDICLMKEGYLCVVYLAASSAEKSDDVSNMLHSVGQSFTS